MKKLGDNIERLIAGLSADTDQARIKARAFQVRSRYRYVIEAVYRTTSPLFLDHTNNVYIMKKDGVNTLIVYVDDSIYASELNAQRELIKLKLLEMFGEQVEEFKIYVSRGKYKNYHPYRDEETVASEEPRRLVPLSEDEKNRIGKAVENVMDEKVRKALEKAMTADMARKKSENGEES